MFTTKIKLKVNQQSSLFFFDNSGETLMGKRIKIVLERVCEFLTVLQVGLIHDIIVSLATTQKVLDKESEGQCVEFCDTQKVK